MLQTWNNQSMLSYVQKENPARLAHLNVYLKKHS